MIRCVVFDFDGTLVLSNAIKREGFFVAVGDLPEGPAVMAKVLDDVHGDRVAVFKRFVQLVVVDAASLVDRYTRWCEERILVCPERTGATAALGELRQRSVRIYVNSATPSASLEAIVARRYPPQTFDGLRGGHGQKMSNLRSILAEAGASEDHVCFVGDGTDDYEAARATGIHFIGVGGGSLAESGTSERLIEDLHALPARIDQLARVVQA